MNIDQANRIAIATILETIGCKPVKETSHDAVYLSPLRIEKTASFNVHKSKNVWFDHGIGQGGRLVDLICAYLASRGEASTVSDALRWIKTMSGREAVIVPVATSEDKKDEPKLLLKNLRVIRHKALVQYLEKRGIDAELARNYLKEVTVENIRTKKTFFALGFPNEDNGFEIRNQFFKGTIRPKHISFVRGKTDRPDTINLFEGFMDFLSALMYQKSDRFNGDAIVLNSLSCMKLATPYIKNYGYRIAYTWLDNDQAGRKGTHALAEFFKTEENLQHKPMNDLYTGHKDVNAWRMHLLGLTL